MESGVHQLLKETVYNKLLQQGYCLYLEPVLSPLWRLNWERYRPDILGTIHNENESRFIFVECETNPSLYRMKNKLLKIKSNLTIQKTLREKRIRIHKLLVILSGNFYKVNYSEIRKFWEIWIINIRGDIIHKIQKLDCS